jgi:ketosteroid isomerase-like protein
MLDVLFDRDIKTIGKHINNALKEELADLSTVADGKVYQMEYYCQQPHHLKCMSQ